MSEPKNNMTKLNQEDYMNGLQHSVEQYKSMHPEEYERHAKIGQYIMSQSYDIESGVDMKGDLIQCKTILYTLLEYNLGQEDLYENEKTILNNVLVKYLGCIEEINNIFLTRENLDKCYQQIIDTLEQEYADVM